MESALAGLALASVAAWTVLLGFRGGFWRADQRLSESASHEADPRPGGSSAAPAPPSTWPPVIAVIPARDEVETIGKAVRSLLRQDYPGTLKVVVVDDASADGTAAAAAAAGSGTDRVTVVRGGPLPAGWVGKVWALKQGLDRAAALEPAAEFYLLTDADIEHAPGSLSGLIDKARTGDLALVSLMVMLHGRSAWERLLVPAFVFFFQKLYPFRWVNDGARAKAAAAGGCMLVRRRDLDAIGGIAAIRANLIDDCALAAHLKKRGPIWLGLATRSRSLRAYGDLSGLWSMVARTAFTQLGLSTPALVGAVVGMIVVYLVPPLAAIAGIAGLLDGPAAGMSSKIIGAIAGTVGWAMMMVAWRPTLRLYALPWWWGALLPVAAALFTLMTIDSARRHWQGRGGRWKGRSYDGSGVGPRARRRARA